MVSFIIMCRVVHRLFHHFNFNNYLILIFIKISILFFYINVKKIKIVIIKFLNLYLKQNIELFLL